MRRRLTEACSGDHRAALHRVEGMLALTDSAIAVVRRIATELRPVLLDEFGLAPAVELQTQDFEKRTEIPCRLSLDNVVLKGDRATALYRILQEALTNVSRHAGATAIHIVLKEEADAVLLEVADNGMGIPDAALTDRRSLGLLGMRERAALVGGTFRAERTPDGGTRVVARVPLLATERGVAGTPAEENHR
jgi:signal transduction histidine kinase